MNKDEKIKELEEKIKTLQHEVKKLQADKMNIEYKITRPRAEKYKTYYFFGVYNVILGAKEKGLPIDNYRYKSGNYFLTKKEAEKYRQNSLTYQQLKDIALRLNKGQKIDWYNRNQNKYYFYFDYRGNRFVADVFICYKDFLTVYCLDPNFLDVALEEIGEKKLQQLLEWGI